ncbi:BamA/TamA family outer membrane protein [Vibrio harveyi]|uniref:BamA/TamA family outer membrane protein n=1 Tax=Vibrio harveyi TaxID=669 RepID=UPI003D72B9D8
MHQKIPFLALLVAALMNPEVTHASFFDAQDGQFDIGHHLAENAVGFLPIPILITEPSVGYGGGIAGLFLHEDDEAKEQRKQAALSAVDGGAQLMPEAITVIGAAGTENGSWFAFAGHQHSWLSDRIRYTGGVGVGKGNLDLFKNLQFGPIDTQLNIGTSTSAWGLMQQIKFRVADTALMLGMKQVLAQSTIEADNPFVDKVMQKILGRDSVTSGLGLIAEYDKRDNYFYPKSGYSISAEYMFYDEALGSDQEYQTLAVDGQVYIPLNDQWNLAFAGNYQKFNSDSVVTPTAQPYVSLRGVSSYHYQGEQVIAGQTQLSYDIDSRWKVSGFYGYGEAQSDGLGDVSSVNAYGAGFRYLIARRYGLYLGIDVAKSDNESALYFNIGSGL